MPPRLRGSCIFGGHDRRDERVKGENRGCGKREERCGFSWRTQGTRLAGLSANPCTTMPGLRASRRPDAKGRPNLSKCRRRHTRVTLESARANLFQHIYVVGNTQNSPARAGFGDAAAENRGVRAYTPPGLRFDRCSKLVAVESTARSAAAHPISASRGSTQAISREPSTDRGATGVAPRAIAEQQTRELTGRPGRRPRRGPAGLDQFRLLDIPRNRRRAASMRRLRSRGRARNNGASVRHRTPALLR